MPIRKTITLPAANLKTGKVSSYQHLDGTWTHNHSGVEVELTVTVLTKEDQKQGMLNQLKNTYTNMKQSK